MSVGVRGVVAFVGCLAVAGIGRPPLIPPLARPSILISKTKRELTLYSGGEAIRTYRVALGRNPIDDKIKEGDRCTPEGRFYVTNKNPQSAFSLSLGISYPNAEHALRGLQSRLITPAQYRQIVRALRRRGTPPQHTALGGDIMIHGGGTQTDWTWGCIALENGDIKELYGAIPVGTPVAIEH